MPNDAEYEKWLAEHLPGYRDRLTKGGLSKNAVDAFIRIAWTPPAITISTVEDYKRACLAHAEMAKSVRKGDWQSPAAVRLHTLGGEMIRFKEEYENEHGRLPDNK